MNRRMRTGSPPATAACAPVAAFFALPSRAWWLPLVADADIVRGDGWPTHIPDPGLRRNSPLTHRAPARVGPAHATLPSRPRSTRISPAPRAPGPNERSVTERDDWTTASAVAPVLGPAMSTAAQ
jgi:hypothetical protein